MEGMVLDKYFYGSDYFHLLLSFHCGKAQVEIKPYSVKKLVFFDME